MKLLWAVRQGDWKLYFPHTYNSLNGREGGTEGLPINYERVTLEDAELYNLHEDQGERHNVYDDHPEIVKMLKSLADKKRLELGDALNDIVGSGLREAGLIE